MALSAAIYNLRNRNPIVNDSNNSSSSSDTNSGISNTNLLSGKDGDSVTKSGNSKLAELTLEHQSLSMEKQYLQLTIMSLKSQAVAYDDNTLWAIGDSSDKNKTDDKKNEQYEKIQKEIETKQARLDKIDARLKEIEAEIAALKAEEATKTQNSEETDSLDDTQKAEIIKQKEAELKETEAKIQELKDKQIDLSAQLKAERAKALPDKQTVASLMEQLHKNGSELNELLTKASELKTELAKLNGTSSDSADNTAKTESTDDVDKAEDAEKSEETTKSSADLVQDKIDKMKAELEELEKRYTELKAKGTPVITRVGRFNVPTVQYDEATQKEMLILQTQIMALRANIAKAEITFKDLKE